MFIRQWTGFLILISIYGVYSSMEIAKGKQTTSSSTYSFSGYIFPSSLAVDGNTSNNLFCRSCMHTIHGAGYNEAYLIITLNGTFSIKLVEIFYRDQYSSQTCGSSMSNLNQTNYRFKGYSIHVSNTSNWRDGTTCYRDTSDPYPPLHVNNTCMGTGSYLTVYNNNTDSRGNAKYPVLELCEVKVYGCMVGYFGPQCSSRCQNCKDDSCDPDSGVCTYGCKDGWLGEMCNTPCPFGFYGANCSTVCGKCIRNETCDHVAGNCTDCATGYQSILCDKECDGKKYGFNCNETCGHCLNSEACDIYDGSCGNGCEYGWTGTLCKTECTNKTFGYNCNETCGNCMDQDQCNRFNGSCPNGCDAGWKGDQCKLECPLWFYGLNCSSKCHHCISNTTCDHVTGHCTGCARGFYGALCDKDCEDKNFGYNCNETCGHCFNSESCNRYDGSCSKGCDSGWSGTLCKTECTAKTFGHSCNESCGNCLNQQPCDRYTGSCPNGCDAGWTGSQCKTECPFGYHGQNCLAVCGRCVNNKTCNPETGVCEQGCTEGFGGSFCKDKATCTDNDKMIAITIGVSSAVLTLTIILVTTACFLRWRRSEAAGTHQSVDQNKPTDLHELPIRGDEQKNVYDVIMKESDERSGRNQQDPSKAYQHLIKETEEVRRAVEQNVAENQYELTARQSEVSREYGNIMN